MKRLYGLQFGDGLRFLALITLVVYTAVFTAFLPMVFALQAWVEGQGPGTFSTNPKAVLPLYSSVVCSTLDLFIFYKVCLLGLLSTSLWYIARLYEGLVGRFCLDGLDVLCLCCGKIKALSKCTLDGISHPNRQGN